MNYRISNTVKNSILKARRKGMAFSILLVLSTQAVSTSAQPLRERKSDTYVNAWTRQQDFVDDHVAKKAVIEMKKMVSDISSLMQLSLPLPESAEPVWSGAYFSNKVNLFPLYKYAFCAEMNTKFVAPDGKTLHSANPLSVTVNDLGSLLLPYRIGNELRNSLPKIKEIAAGIWYSELPRGSDNESPTKIWLISYAKGQPFSIMTRKEYLEQALIELENQKQELEQNLKILIPVRPFQEQQESYEQTRQEIQNMYSGNAAKERTKIYSASIKSDSDYFRQVFDGQAAPLVKDSTLMDSLLHNLPADELNKPAFVNGPVLSFRGFQDSSADSRMIISWDMNYFKKDISLTRPQFMVVSWQFNPNDATALKLDEQLAEKLNFNDLASMLGK